MCRSESLWSSVDVIVDMECTTTELERVATEVVNLIKLHPRWFGGDYRVLFTEPVSGWKLKLAVWFNYNDSGTTLPLHCTFAFS